MTRPWPLSDQIRAVARALAVVRTVEVEHLLHADQPVNTDDLEVLAELLGVRTVELLGH